MPAPVIGCPTASPVTLETAVTALTVVAKVPVKEMFVAVAEPLIAVIVVPAGIPGPVTTWPTVGVIALKLTLVTTLLPAEVVNSDDGDREPVGTYGAMAGF